MIKAQDLRIGNYIQDEVGSIFLVAGLQEVSIMTTSGGGYFTEKIFTGVELTEDWLLKFGFQKTADLFIRSDIAVSLKNKFLYRNWVATDKEVYEKYTGWLPCASDLNYVHQLQNLFFALTGEELTIKP